MDHVPRNLDRLCISGLASRAAAAAASGLGARWLSVFPCVGTGFVSFCWADTAETDNVNARNKRWVRVATVCSKKRELPITKARLASDVTACPSVDSNVRSQGRRWRDRTTALGPNCADQLTGTIRPLAADRECQLLGRFRSPGVIRHAWKRASGVYDHRSDLGERDSPSLNPDLSGGTESEVGKTTGQIRFRFNALATTGAK